MANLVFLGRLADLARDFASNSFVLPPNGQHLSEIVNQIGKINLELGQALAAPSVRVAINLELIEIGADPIVKAEDEIAFMPPVSGG